jgi:predicted dehydrogenase
MKAIRAALAGFNETGLAFVDALQKAGNATVIAIGDDRPEALRAAADCFSVPTHLDFRSLIVESVPRGVNLLLVAMEPHQTVDLLATAADCRVPVLLKSPPARDVREARGLIESFDRAGVVVAVARGWQFEPAYSLLLNGRRAADHVCCASAEVTAQNTPEGWRGDRAKSGGGALLCSAYDVIDMLVCALGQPDSVFAQCTTAIPIGTPQKYDTEDAGIVCLRYPNTAAVITARRGAATAGWSVRIVGSERVIEVAPKRMVVSPTQGGKTRQFRVKTESRFLPLMQALIAHLSDEPGRFASTLRDHLPTLAAIDAAYLSARTGQPESTARVAERD